MTKKHRDSSSVERAVEKKMSKPKKHVSGKAAVEKALREVPKSTYKKLERTGKFRTVKICRRLSMDGKPGPDGEIPKVSTNICWSCPLVAYGEDCTHRPLNEDQK